MKILMMTLRADIGGGPKYLLELIKSLESQKDLEIFVASPNEEPFFEEYRKLAKNILVLPHRKFRILSFLKLVIFLKKNKINIVHSHGRGAGVYSRLLKLFGFKVVHTYHGVHFEIKIKKLLALIFEKILLNLSDCYIFCSDDEKKEAFKWGLKPKNFKVILNSVDIEKYKKREIRNNLEVLGTIARFDPIKGYDQLFRNIHFLNNNNLIFKYIIAGVGYEDLKNYEVPENVEVIGEIRDVESFYSKIDLQLSHSQREGMPLTVLEAMASGVPCLLSSVPGHNYFIENQMALGFELTSSADFSEKLLSLLSKDNRVRLSDIAYSKTIKNHSKHNLMEKNLEIYRNL